MSITTGPAARRHVRNLLASMGFDVKVSIYERPAGNGASPHVELRLHGTTLYDGDWWQGWNEEDRKAEPPA